MFIPRSIVFTLVVFAGGLATAANVRAAEFTTSYTDGGSWGTIYAQGFAPAMSPTPAPGVASGETVYLDRFEFYKSGNPDSATDVRLVILNNFYANLQGLNTTSSSVVGLSTNTIASTAPIATGGAIAFEFDDLALTYGSDYGAVFVNVGPNGELTPVLVSALTANYADIGGGDWHPQSNYGTEDQFQYAVSNWINTNEFGQFFQPYSYAGDANFVATLNTVVPEPAMLGVLGVAAVALLRRR